MHAGVTAGGEIVDRDSILAGIPVLTLRFAMAHNAAAAVDHGEGIRTSSRCVVEGATHDFQVTNYRLLDGMCIRKYVSSSTFRVGGYDWNIRLYPDGNRAEAAGYASAFLCYLSQTKDVVRASFTLTMPDDQGNIQATMQAPGYIFGENENVTGGFPDFVEKSKLRSSSPLLTIRCVLAVIKEPPAECKSNLIVDPPPELPGRLYRALKNGIGTDIKLLVCGREFSAHRFTLAAQSPVFEAQLFGPMAQKDIQRIKIVDMEPAIFEMLLHYIYTDSLPPCGQDNYDTAMMQHLLVAADRYGLDRLKVMCEKRLCENINASTVTSTLALATHHYCNHLKDACLKFMSSSRKVMDAVVITDGFQHLMASCPMLDLQKNTGEKVTIQRK